MTDLFDALLKEPFSIRHGRCLLRLTTASIAIFALLLALAACTQTGGEGTATTAPVATTATATASLLVETKPAPIAAPTEPTTASPTATLLPIPPTVTPQPTAKPAPTATPLPTPTPRPPIPDSTRFELGSGLVLSVSPENAVAGREVSFSLAGVPTWAKVNVKFVDPQGVPASWITAEDVHLLEMDQTQATTYQMYPPISGILE